MPNGKICYVLLPAKDPQDSARFYAAVFGWNVRKRGDGALAFDDATGQVSGSFVTDKRPSEPGLLFYVMVDDIDATVRLVEQHGGKLEQPVSRSREIIATFRDPGGNLIGLYQEPGK